MKKLWFKIKMWLGIKKAAKQIEGNFQTWYGRVNRWRRSRSILEKDILACQKHGVSGYLIELAHLEDEVNGWHNGELKKIEKEYKYLLKLCRTAGLWVFVSVINDNMGKNKYGSKSPTLDKVYNEACTLIDIVKNNGSKNVIVQPVAETQTAAGKKFEKECAARLGGFKLVYNGNGGQPTGTNGWNFAAYHPSAISKKVAAGMLAVSDHGLIIRELNQGGSLDAAGDPAKVTAWKNNVRKWNCPVCGYYAFHYDKFDEGTIKALGHN